MEDHEIENIVKELKQLECVQAVVLFGSHATGKTRPYSDIDICVITKSQISKGSRNEILSHGSRKIDINIFADLPLYIQLRIFQHGQFLFVRDHQFIVQTRYETIKKYQDFWPRLEKYYNRVLA